MVFIDIALHVHNLRRALQDFRLPVDEIRGKHKIAKSIVSLKFEPKAGGNILQLPLGFLEGTRWGSGAGGGRHVWILYAEDGFSAAKFPVLHI